jgi:hypothetical protein
VRLAAGSDIASMSWAVNVSGEPVPLIAYPHGHTKRGACARSRGARADDG